MCFCNFKVDVCKRVIHLYRSVVLEVPMEPTTWYYNFTFNLASIYKDVDLWNNLFLSEIQ